MAHELPPLPYPKEALEPHIDALTMEIHHDRHHKAYVDNLNKAIAGNAALEAKSLDALIGDLASVPDNIRGPVRTNGGGGLSHVPSPHGIDSERSVGVGLAGIDRRVGTTVEDQVWAEALDRLAYRVAVDKIERVDIGGQNLKGPWHNRREQGTVQICLVDSPGRNDAGQHVTDVAPELAVASGDKDPLGIAHRPAAPDSGPAQAPSTTGARSRRGSHQDRFRAYQATVSANPCSKGTVGSHPSSLRIFEESSR